MKFSELTADVAADCHQPRATAEMILEAACERLARCLAEDDETPRLPVLGRLVTQRRPAREGRDPRNGAPIQVRAKRVPKFMPSKALLDMLNPPLPKDALAKPRRMVGGDRVSP